MCLAISHAGVIISHHLLLSVVDFPAKKTLSGDNQQQVATYQIHSDLPEGGSCRAGGKSGGNGRRTEEQYLDRLGVFFVGDALTVELFVDSVGDPLCFLLCSDAKLSVCRGLVWRRGNGTCERVVVRDLLAFGSHLGAVGGNGGGGEGDAVQAWLQPVQQESAPALYSQKRSVLPTVLPFFAMASARVNAGNLQVDGCLNGISRPGPSHIRLRTVSKAPSISVTPQRLPLETVKRSHVVEAPCPRDIRPCSTAPCISTTLDMNPGTS